MARKAEDRLGDFTATLRLVPISLIAVAIALLSACVALALLRLIGLFTNLFFFQRWDFALVSPGGEPARRGRGPRARRRRAHHRLHGPLRVRAHPGPRDPRGARVDPDPRQPR